MFVCRKEIFKLNEEILFALYIRLLKIFVKLGMKLKYYFFGIYMYVSANFFNSEYVIINKDKFLYFLWFKFFSSDFLTSKFLK